MQDQAVLLSNCLRCGKELVIPDQLTLFGPQAPVQLSFPGWEDITCLNCGMVMTVNSAENECPTLTPEESQRLAPLVLELCKRVNAAIYANKTICEGLQAINREGYGANLSLNVGIILGRLEEGACGGGEVPLVAGDGSVTFPAEDKNFLKNFRISVSEES